MMRARRGSALLVLAVVAVGALTGCRQVLQSEPAVTGAGSPSSGVSTSPVGAAAPATPSAANAAKAANTANTANTANAANAAALAAVASAVSAAESAATQGEKLISQDG